MKRFNFYIAILTAFITIVTFGIALFTPPISGPFCPDSCIDYPYNDIGSHFPRDYLWMYPAILSALLYVVLVVCINQYSAEDKKIYRQVGLSLSIISAALLITDYFLQISVIQPAIVNGEKDGIALLTQFNPHWVFIALEELGYLMMSLSFLNLAPVFSKTDRIERAIRLIFIISFLINMISFIAISIQYGVHREYYFEVIVIFIDWIVLITSAILLAKNFIRKVK